MAGDPGLFGPGSVTWRVNGESVLLAGGGRALLLQVAHPSVAAGVEQHSSYDTDPWGRLIRTLDVVTKITFGDSEASARAVIRPDGGRSQPVVGLHFVHRVIRRRARAGTARSHAPTRGCRDAPRPAQTGHRRSLSRRAERRCCSVSTSRLRRSIPRRSPTGSGSTGPISPRTFGERVPRAPTPSGSRAAR